MHLEDYKRWLTDDLDDPYAGPGRSLSATSRSLRLGSLRMFFTRLIEWDYPDAPTRPLLFLGDLPPRDQVLPKALDDADAAKFLRTAQAQPRLLTRVVAEVLIRTGVRVGELCALHADAVRTGHDGFWLHVPVGKLHDDRYLPLHPTLVDLIGNYRRQHVTDNNPKLIPYENGRPLRPAAVARMLDNITSAAGMPHVHPHKLRHTLATQAINRGMSMEAIAALLGHHSLDMTRRYARLHDKTLATAYFDVTDKVDALYNPPTEGRRTVTSAPGDARTAARQRPLHPAPAAGLPARHRLRNLHLLPDQHRLPARPASPTRRRRHQRVHRPPTGLPRAPQPRRRTSRVLDP